MSISRQTKKTAVKKDTAVHKRTTLFRLLTSHLRTVTWLNKNEYDEIDASVSHWMQNPQISVPFFSTAIRNECIAHLDSFFNGGLKRNTSASCVRESTEYYQQKLNVVFDVPYPPPVRWDFTFIDLFAGIGGFPLAFQQAGGKCVFCSEWDNIAWLGGYGI